MQRLFLPGLALAAAPGCFHLVAPFTSTNSPEASAAPDPAALWLPEGYQAHVVAQGLTFPAGITVGADGTVWVVESGYAYGDVWLAPRLLRVLADGTWEVFATGDDAPWTGVDEHEGLLYVAEGGLVNGGSILRFSPDGATTVLVDGLPGHGDHHTNGPVVGPDGWVYFSQGTATNSGYVGIDNYDFGWLSKRPSYHDTPCADVRVTGVNYTTPNPLTEAPNDEAVTGAFVPFGTPTAEGQRILGSVPCNGAVMRVPVDGGAIELVAWGFRNPFGLAFSPDDRLYVTDNGPDERGSRPIFGAGDWLWEVQTGGWYGWPDFAGGEPVASPRFDQMFMKRARPALFDPPGDPPDPVATFGVHSSADGIAFAPEAFGYAGEAFVAEFGDMSPGVGPLLAPVGRRVVRVDVETGVIHPFAAAKAGEPGAAGLHRPTAVAFSPDGKSLYVADFGVMAMEGVEPQPRPETGVVWRIDRVGEGRDAPVAGQR